MDIQPLTWIQNLPADLSGPAQAVALRLIPFADGRTGGNIHPGLSKLVELTHMCRKSVIKGLNELEDKKLLEKVAKGRGTLAAVYKLHDPSGASDAPLGSPSGASHSASGASGTTPPDLLPDVKNSRGKIGNSSEKTAPAGRKGKGQPPVCNSYWVQADGSFRKTEEYGAAVERRGSEKRVDLSPAEGKEFWSTRYGPRGELTEKRTSYMQARYYAALNAQYKR